MPAESLRRTTQMTGQEWLLLIALSVPWGGSFFFYKVLGETLPPVTIVLGRCGLAALALNLLLAMRGGSLMRHRALWPSFLVMGVVNNVVPFILFAWAETRITSGMASILNATTPIFSVLVMRVAGGEQLTPGRVLGVMCGFAGVVVLLAPQVGHGGDLLGQGACLLSALCYAFAGLFGRRFRGAPPVAVATGQLTGSALVLLPLAALVDQPWALPAPDAWVWANLLGLALVSTALAYMVFFRLLATAGASNLLLVTFLVPITALLLGWLFLGEAITLDAVAGIALIAVSLAAIDGRPFARLRAGARAG